MQDYKDRPDELNLNCTDPLGRTSLVIAIENESFELIEVLLEGGIKVSDGLLHAISEDYVEAVELLLEWEERTHKEGSPYVCFTSQYLNIFKWLTKHLKIASELGNARQRKCHFYARYHSANFGCPSKQLRDSQIVAGSWSCVAHAPRRPVINGNTNQQNSSLSTFPLVQVRLR